MFDKFGCHAIRINKRWQQSTAVQAVKHLTLVDMSLNPQTMHLEPVMETEQQKGEYDE
ncbi:MAG: hypothetical protein J1F42_01800 [Lachnospiraceae bacterium]|nr:hypothetical protein [Lachnospiraceae bacterium]